MKRYLVLILVVFASAPVFAQLRAYPVYRNNALKQFLAARPNYTWNQAKLGKVSFVDTLDLPFFDDFSQDYPYPDSSLWQNNQVYVNPDFGINPPSIGVASFDNLDAQGNPYSDLNAGVISRSDSMTSQSIRLDSFLVGFNRVASTLADSIYLSFFCQPQGYSYDKLDTADALTLEFKRADGIWIRVWKKNGGPLDTFNYVIVPITDAQFLHSTFQFRFVNYARNTGFSNLWHVDYIDLDRNRRFADVIKDVAIRETPTSLLSRYHSMSWKQFIANSVAEKSPNHSFRVHNMDVITANVAFQYQAFNRFGTTINISDFASNNDNIDPRSDKVYSFSNYNFDTLSGKPVTIRQVYSIDNAASNPVHKENDNYTVTQVFDDYLAYDDGTAEQGLGLDYGSVPPNSQGQVAIRFHLNVPDTITAIAAFFTQATKDVSVLPFQLRIWQDITEGTNNSTLLRAVEMPRPPYTDSLNGFSYTYLADSFVVLPAGDFYIGWSQNMAFFLNVGLDRGYRVNGADTENPNLYYNLYGIWEAADVLGAPMIRPVFNREQPILSVKPVHADRRSLNVYPNPARNEIYWTDNVPDGEYSIMDMAGRVVSQGVSENRRVFFGELPAGFYVLHVKDSYKQVTYTQKLVVNP